MAGKVHPHPHSATPSIYSQADKQSVIDFIPFYYSIELFGMLLL